MKQNILLLINQKICQRDSKCFTHNICQRDSYTGSLLTVYAKEIASVLHTIYAKEIVSSLRTIHTAKMRETKSNMNHFPNSFYTHSLKNHRKNRCEAPLDFFRGMESLSGQINLPRSPLMRIKRGFDAPSVNAVIMSSI